MTGQMVQCVGSVNDRAVADADDGVPTRCPRRLAKRHHAEVAALGDERDAAAGSPRPTIVAPHAAHGWCTATIPFAFGPMTGRACRARGLDQGSCRSVTPGLGELGGEDDGATAAEASCGVEQRRAPCRPGLR